MNAASRGLQRSTKSNLSIKMLTKSNIAHTYSNFCLACMGQLQGGHICLCFVYNELCKK